MYPQLAANQSVNFRHVLACAMLCALLGCQSLTRRGPVSKEVLSCRQLSAQGISAMEQGNWQEAENLLGSAIKTCPIDSDARRRYAEVLWHRGDAAGAMGQLEEAAKLSPDKSDLPIRMGEIYLALDRWQNARRSADQALAIDRQNPAAWALRAQAAHRGGDVRQALADYQRALGYSPNNPAVLEQLAELYRQMGQPERALTALQSLIDIFPPGEEPVRALHLQGLALASLGRTEAAIESYDLAVRQGNPSPDLLCHLAEAKLLLGRTEEARSTVEVVLQMAPQHAGGQAVARQLQMTASQPPSALRR